ncbi:M14 family metallopeptidase [Bacillus sp. FJAT-45350]|uniref:M14 family metallopeptidase n=1 Tax=Bacillus sp. FJAT-45350 TaxID=2011014 RepID=UPI000BB84D29|nr:M14 family metallopeptidase [Bacillus sp. FJAT-45350]
MKSYIVQKGDTISKIALKHGIRPIELVIANHHIKNELDYVQPKEEIMIPREGSFSGKYSSRYTCVAEYGPTDLEKDAFRLKKKYPSLINVREIGTSVMGQPLYVFEIGTGKKEIFYSGGWHANEWLTTKFLITFLEEVVESATENEQLHGYNVSKILSDITLYIVPLVNPDGVELVQQGIYKDHPFYETVNKINKGALRFEHWSSNIRGVDLNHQWPAGWQKEADESPKKPWSRHYSGKGPLTEPESQAVHQLTLSKNFAHVIAFHSQGQMIFWGYRHLEPKESEEMVTRLSLASSYAPIHTADSDGGYKDWFIQEMRRPGFTVEVGVGTNPLPFTSFSEIWSNNVLLALEGLTI